MISILAFLLRMGVLLLFTFGFVVLYEHGPKDYMQSARDEGKAVWEWGMGKESSRSSSPTPVPEAVKEPLPALEPTPTPTPTPTLEPTPEPSPVVEPTPAPGTTPAAPSSTAPEAWQNLQDTPIGTDKGPKPSKQSQ